MESVKLNPSSHVKTNAFLFDTYNHERCVSQHHESIRELAYEIVTDAVGASSVEWMRLRSSSSKGNDPSSQSGLPLSFTCRHGSSSSSSRRKKRKYHNQPQHQFEQANRRRVCVCVPVAGSRWWEPGNSPCGRRGQQCGCIRGEPYVGTVWEVWRGELESWQLAIVVREEREASFQDDEGISDGASSEQPPAQQSSVLDVAFVADGHMVLVYRAWLRPPSVHVESIADLEEFGVAVCVCAHQNQAQSFISANPESPLSTSPSTSLPASEDTAAVELLPGSLEAVPSTNAGSALNETNAPLATSARLPGVHDKHWEQRHRYFSRFDQGVSIDFEGWYSITPEVIAQHVAKRVSVAMKNKGTDCFTVFDAFCGCGGNAISFAMEPGCFVVACDIDPVKIACAKTNAHVYNVAHKIEFIVADSANFLTQLASQGNVCNELNTNRLAESSAITASPTRRFDVVCLAPPWGGPDYLSAPVFCLENMLKCPCNGREYLKLAYAAAPSVVMLIPRTVDPDQLGGLLLPKPKPEEAVCSDQSTAAHNLVRVEVEDTAINYKVKMKVAYYGDDFSCRERRA